MKRFAWLLSLVVALALLAGAAGAQAPPVKRFAVPIEGSPSRGPADAPVTVVEFLDFQ